MSINSATGLILAVDDTPANLDILSKALKEAGFAVAVEIDGEGAIEQVEYHTPDLILLDVQMPGIDGFETCRRLKMNPATKEIPVIFMTALNDTAHKVKGLTVGAVDYITKPFEQEEVLARVRVHLQLYQLQQQLEQRVKERTTELQQALNNLQQTQIQLVQNEKMSTLGQLVAGVAHEVNNPVSFIAGNVQHIENYFQDLINHLQLYQHYYPEPVKDITDHAEEIDLEFLVDDAAKMITSQKVGAERIRNISTSLRTFSRADTDHPITTDLHEGIDSTLLILKHRLKANDKHPEIQVVKEYGNLPLIECYPGQLNQVFMNLLANAIDALEQVSLNFSFEELQANPHQITIRTAVATGNGGVTIYIQDNGPGMSTEVKAKIFDYLFTTKDVGKGTGLGLSISRQIIEDKHQGRLSCNSVLGQGTEFLIKLPCKLSNIEP